LTFYVDTSAFVKLFQAEAESDVLRRWWRDHEGAVFSSELLRTEALRTARRISGEAVSAARWILEMVPLVSLDPAAYERAGLLDPRALRSLDALHLVTALAGGDELEGIVSYDDRLIQAARLHGVPTLSPR